MSALRARVRQHDVHAWVRGFIDALEQPSVGTRPAQLLDADGISRVAQRMRAAKHLHLILDYDGTLVPFSSRPELAEPDGELLELLQGLCNRDSISVHIVSGRDRHTVEKWLGAVNADLYAENGWWHRTRTGEWQAAHEDAGTDWKEHLRPILEDFAARTPGAFIEEKTMAFAWHYQGAASEFGMQQAQELRLHLGQLSKEAEVEMLPGAHVVEVRRHGVKKGTLVPTALAQRPGLVVAVGDDRSDEDLYAAVPSDGMSIHVGAVPTRARYRMENPQALRGLLRALLLSS